MATFKELQERVDIAEQQVKEALDLKILAENGAAEIVVRAEALEKKTRDTLAQAAEIVARTEDRAALAEHDAQLFGFERNEWWEKVYLSVIAAGLDLPASELVLYATEVATKSVGVRAGQVEALLSNDEK